MKQVIVQQNDIDRLEEARILLSKLVDNEKHPLYLRLMKVRDSMYYVTHRRYEEFKPGMIYRIKRWYKKWIMEML